MWSIIAGHGTTLDGVHRPPKVWTIVVGGGSGRRFGRPKQYEPLGDERIIDRSRRVAEAASAGVVVVVPAADADRERAVAGGSTRSESVRAGLAGVPADCDIVCIHDAARPLATTDLYQAVIDAVSGGLDGVDPVDGAVPGIPVADTIKTIDERGVVVATPDRATLVGVQTPQAFRADVLRRAHESGVDGTDDASLVEQAGGRVVVVPGDPHNRKITLPDDLSWARAVVAGRSVS
jgi:2-C-methyl-D-erythritol 4-phosphate cytidylyltransferase